MQSPKRLLYLVVAGVFTFLLIIVAFLTSSRSFQKNAQVGNSPESVTEETLPPVVSAMRYVGAGCKIGGCSSQLCVDESNDEVVTNCQFKEEYACYQNYQLAICEKQTNGQCGWTQTEELKACLKDPSVISPDSGTDISI
jgi:hypothetical protein